MRSPFIKALVILASYLLFLLSPVGAQEVSPDAGVPVAKGKWLVFRLPDELKGATGVSKQFSVPETSLRLEVIALLPHPGLEALQGIAEAREASSDGSSPANSSVSNPLVKARHSLERWRKLASDTPEYSLAVPEGSAHPLSKDISTDLKHIEDELLRLEKIRTEDAESARSVREALDSAHKRLAELTSDEFHRGLLQLVMTPGLKGEHELGTLGTVHASTTDKDYPVVVNKLTNRMEDIIFTTVDDRDYAFCFSYSSDESRELIARLPSLSSARHTTTRPNFVISELKIFPGLYPLNEQQAQIKLVCVIFIAFLLWASSVTTAGVTWEVCRSRESLSSRETFRTFSGALIAWTFLGFVVLLSNYLFPAESDILTMENLPALHAIPIAGMLMLGALLPTLGARLGCRFGKRGCKAGTGFGFLIGLAVSSAFVSWILTPTGGAL